MGHNERAANGQQCLNCLSQQMGQPHTDYEKRDFKQVWCDVKLPSGEKKQCESHFEFDELVKVYMEQ